MFRANDERDAQAMIARLRAFPRQLALLFAAGCVSLLSVCGDLNGPDRPHRAQVALAPMVSSGAAAAIGASDVVIDNVRIVLRRLDGTIVLDTVIVFPAGEDEVAFAADVEIHGGHERMRATIQLRRGTEVLFEGEEDVDVRAGVQTEPAAPIPLAYVGPGANAASVVLAPGDVTINANGSSPFTATVRDAAGNVIPNVPIGWSSSANDVASVGATGVVAARAIRGSATITASTFGGVSGHGIVHVVLPPSELRLVAGSGQTGRVTEALGTPFTVQLIAPDGVGVANASVSFAASGTASVTPPTVTTDASGRASASMTLGTNAGTYTFTATSGSFSASAAATATPGDLNRIAIASGNGQSGFTGAALAQSLAVRVTDEFGNGGSGRTVTWTTSAGAVASATTTTDATGLASNSYTLPPAAGAQAIVASIATGASVTFTATAVPRDPAAIALASDAVQVGRIGTAAQPLVVKVSDALGQPAANATVTWAISGPGTLGAASSTTNAEGLASVGANFGTTLGNAVVTARIANGTGVQFTLITIPGPPASLTIVAGDNQNGTTGAAVPVPPTVRVRDALGNPVPGFTVTFGNVTGGGSVTGATPLTDTQGLAHVGSWILGTGTSQTLTATVGTLSVVFTATLGPPVSFLSAGAGDGQIVTQFSTAQPLVAHAFDAGEGGVPGASIRFTVLSGSATPTQFTTTTDANGQATFTPSVGAAGTSVVQACVMPACTIATTFTITIITSGTIWIGVTSSDWFTASNWSPAVVPGTATNVYIQSGTPNFPVLTGNVSVNSLFLAQGALMGTGTFETTIGANFTATGAFLFGTGTFRLTGTGATISGDMPSLVVDGTIAAVGNTDIGGNVLISGTGRLSIGAGNTTVTGGFTIDPGGHLSMNNASGSLSITGDAFFGGADMGDGDLTAGVLDIRGNLTAAAGPQAFRATGTHKTRLSGINLQTISFSNPGAGTSRFQQLEIANPSANGVTMSSNVYVAGNFLQNGNLTVPVARTFTVAGTATLQSGTLTTVLGTISFGSCVNFGGTAVGFTC